MVSSKRAVVVGCLMALILALATSVGAAGPRLNVNASGLPKSISGGTLDVVLDPQTSPVASRPGTVQLTAPGLLHAKPNEDFEGTWPAAGWEVLDNMEGVYQWGARDCHPHTGAKAAWCIGGGTTGTSTSCSTLYPANYETWAVYGPFSLADAAQVTWHFSIQGQCEFEDQCRKDWFKYGISTNGADFNTGYYCGDWRNEDGGNGYTNVSADISSWAGQLEVWIALIFVSDGSTQYGGMMVDDIWVETTAATPTHTPTVAPTDTATPTQTTEVTPSPTATQGDTATPTPSPTATVPGEPRRLYLPLIQSRAAGLSLAVDV